MGEFVMPVAQKDPRTILIEAGKSYIRANAPGWVESQIEAYVPGLIDALLHALAAHRMSIK